MCACEPFCDLNETCGEYWKIVEGVWRISPALSDRNEFLECSCVCILQTLLKHLDHLEFLRHLKTSVKISEISGDPECHSHGIARNISSLGLDVHWLQAVVAGDFDRSPAGVFLLSEGWNKTTGFDLETAKPRAAGEKLKLSVVR